MRMARPRKKDRNLPECYHHRHGAYYYVKGGKWTRLGVDDACVFDHAKQQRSQKGALNPLIDEALSAIKRGVVGKTDGKPLAPATQDQYDVAAEKLKFMLKMFSDPNAIDMSHVMDLKRELAKTPNMANRCVSLLRSMFTYWVEKKYAKNNPAIGVPRYVEAKRKRLISESEFSAIYAHAGPRLQVIMDLFYLTGQRVNDVLRIRYADLKDEGIYFEQDKTEARLIVRWTPQLRAAVERAKTLHGNVRALTLFHTRRGMPPAYKTVYDQFVRAAKRAGIEDVQQRDFRAMSGTATKRQGKNPTALLGHKSQAMTERYLRDKEVPEVDGPSFGQVLDVGQKGAK